MVVNVVDLATKGVPREGCRQLFCNPSALAFVAPTVEQHRDAWAAPQRVYQLTAQIRAAVLVDRYMLYVMKADTRRIQAVADGLGRETCPMLDTAKALFLGSGNHLAVAQKARGRVAVEGVNAEDIGH